MFACCRIRASRARRRGIAPLRRRLAPLLAETHREWAAKTGHAILERRHDRDQHAHVQPLRGPARAGLVGHPLPGVDLRITDPETGKPPPQGEIGMIEVKGPNVFSGRWRMPEKTNAEFRPDGFFITGDLGKIGDGYVYIVGRGKDLVITDGYNVYPGRSRPRSTRSTASSRARSSACRTPTSARASRPSSSSRRGRRSTSAPLPPPSTPGSPIQAPKRVLFADYLPRNAMGKVLKNEARERYRDLYAMKRAAG